MSREVKRMTLKALKGEGACEEGMEWITPLIEAGDAEGVKVALCNEHPVWAQWAHRHGFDVLPDDQSARNGATISDGKLVFYQTAGNDSTQTAGYGSTQTAGYGSTQKAGGRSTQAAGYHSTQTAGDDSTQTAGDYSTQIAGEGSRHKGRNGTVAICRYWRNDRYLVATKVLDSDEFFWSYNVESDEWEHSVDQSDPVSKDVEK